MAIVTYTNLAPEPETEPTPTPVQQPVVGDFERRIKALEEVVSKLREALR